MKRLLTLTALLLTATVVIAAETQPATPASPTATAPTTAPATPAAYDNPYAADFTKGMAEWKLNKAEGKQDKDGLKITKTSEYGGIINDDNRKGDLSTYKTVSVDFVNNDTKEAQIIMKIGSGQSDKRTEEAVALPVGAKTLTWKIAGDPVDPANITYMNFWVVEEGNHDIIIKKISFQ
jgi:hypothetical protein